MLGDAVYRASAIAQVKATDLHASDPWFPWRCPISAQPHIRCRVQTRRRHQLGCINGPRVREKEVENAWLTNAFGQKTRLVAESLGVPYVYISTAGIFGGEVYTTIYSPNPSVYAKKYYAERYTLNTVSKHYVFRAGWMMEEARR